MRFTLDLCRSRVETKYHVSAEEVSGLPDRILADEREDYAVRTLYFDRPDGSLARKAFEDPFHCTKVRAREYAGGSSVWFEVKTRRGRWTRKSRLHLDRPEATRLLDGIAAEPSAPPTGAGEEEAEARRFLRDFSSGDLVPVGVVTARRQTFILKSPQVRITLDRDIAFYRASTDPFGTTGGDSEADLLRCEPEPVLEVKHAGTLPLWCEELIARMRNSTYSKFRTLVEALAAPGRMADHVDRL
jgi:hypothetical protein